MMFVIIWRISSRMPPRQPAVNPGALQVASPQAVGELGVDVLAEAVGAEPVGAVRAMELGAGERLRPVLGEHRPDDREQHQQQLEAKAEDQLLVPQPVVDEVAAVGAGCGGLRLLADVADGHAHAAAPCMLSRVLGSTVMNTRSMMKLAISTPITMKMKMPCSRK